MDSNITVKNVKLNSSYSFKLNSFKFFLNKKGLLHACLQVACLFTVSKQITLLSASGGEVREMRKRARKDFSSQGKRRRRPGLMDSLRNEATWVFLC
jgi:hypothetical protein